MCSGKWPKDHSNVIGPSAISKTKSDESQVKFFLLALLRTSHLDDVTQAELVLHGATL